MIGNFLSIPTAPLIRDHLPSFLPRVSNPHSEPSVEGSIRVTYTSRKRRALAEACGREDLRRHQRWEVSRYGRHQLRFVRLTEKEQPLRGHPDFERLIKYGPYPNSSTEDSTSWVPRFAHDDVQADRPSRDPPV